MEPIELSAHDELLVAIFTRLEHGEGTTPRKLAQVLKRYPLPGGALFTKDQLVAAYRRLAGSNGLQPAQERVWQQIRMKPVRTQSGVAPITVLTKPFPCPGKCIFCPNDVRMPKSYLSDEPGAQRAERNWFDPYLQTFNRLLALRSIGHIVDKAEIIVLGGTWSYYPEAYQIWFVKECFRALNDFSEQGDLNAREHCENIVKNYESMQLVYAQRGQYQATADPSINKRMTKHYAIRGTQLSQTYNQTVSQLYVGPERLAGFDAYQSATWQELDEQHQRNAVAKVRCVGLVVETRPDNISEAEVTRMRRLGCTKTQIGLQSLQDSVLAKNNRGHDVAASRRAIKLLRQAGFKIHAHWMANLYGSSVEQDKQDFALLFDDPDFRPDELKVYPCSLLESAELMQYYQDGRWRPYSRDELLEVLGFCITHTPAYCRLTRIIRDIPSTDIVAGNKLTNFRQIAEQELAKVGAFSLDIRAREIKQQAFDPAQLTLQTLEYATSCSTEKFLQFVTPENRIVGFLRLSLPTLPSFMPELAHSALIREVHVYGRVAKLGTREKDNAQHLGLGAQLVAKAIETARAARYEKIAVISAIGTRRYYQKLGFNQDGLYQSLKF